MGAGKVACISTAGVDSPSCCALLILCVHVVAHTLQLILPDTSHATPGRRGSPVSPANSALPSPPSPALMVDSGDKELWRPSVGVQPRH